jgi:hypothetical protein
MVDAEGRGDGAFQCSAVIQPANLGVLLGRDHGVSSPKTRDEFARAVEGARRFLGHRPCNTTRPPGGAVGTRSIVVSAGSVASTAVRWEV